jgi:hypothetical protein
MNQALEVVHFLFKIHHVNRPLLSYLESALRERASFMNLDAPCDDVLTQKDQATSRFF